MAEIEITFPSGDIELAGTISLPEGAESAPGFVLIHGSDAVDRDGNPEPRLYEGHPLAGLRLDTLRQIAGALTEAGLAVLRYDKRGTGRSGGDHLRRSLSALYQDASAAVERLRAEPGVDEKRVGVVGHSEGSLLAAMIADRNKSIAAYVSCAGPVGNLRDLALWQAQRLPNPETVVAQVEAVFKRAVDGEDLVVAEGGYRESGSWLRDWLQTDVKSALAKVRCPALVIQGDKDFHSPWNDAIEFARTIRDAGNNDVTLSIFPNVDHFLMFEPEISTSVRYLEQPDRRVEPLVLRTLVAWAERVLVRKEPPPPSAGQGQSGLIE